MTDPAPRVEFTEDERVRMDDATRDQRLMEGGMNTLMDAVPFHLRDLACQIRLFMRRQHERGVIGVANGLLPMPREDQVGIPPAREPDLGEGGGKGG